MPVVGFINTGSPEAFANLVRAFRDGLGKEERLPAFATDLVCRQVNVIAATGEVPQLLAKVATTTIPIVFMIGADAVQAGLVSSMNCPGGNITVTYTLSSALHSKLLELLRELVSERDPSWRALKPSGTWRAIFSSRH
jgi:putative ABC transport system substrate-binding protein